MDRRKFLPCLNVLRAYAMVLLNGSEELRIAPAPALGQVWAAQGKPHFIKSRSAQGLLSACRSIVGLTRAPTDCQHCSGMPVKSASFQCSLSLGG